MRPTAALQRLRSLKGKVEAVTFKLLFKVRGGPTPAAASSLLLLLLWQHAHAPEGERPVITMLAEQIAVAKLFGLAV